MIEYTSEPKLSRHELRRPHPPALWSRFPATLYPLLLSPPWRIGAAGANDPLRPPRRSTERPAMRENTHGRKGPAWSRAGNAAERDGDNVATKSGHSKPGHRSEQTRSKKANASGEQPAPRADGGAAAGAPSGRLGWCRAGGNGWGTVRTGRAGGRVPRQEGQSGSATL